MVVSSPTAPRVRSILEEQPSPSTLLAPAYRDISLVYTHVYGDETTAGGTYSVKCFARSPSNALNISRSKSCSPFASARRRRALTELDAYEEFRLHQRVSAHPNVATAHLIVAHAPNIFLVLDHSPDGHLLDLIQERRNPVGSAFIKQAFLQLLDAVEHCHALGVYHRNLRPEAVVCARGGRHLAITDFGLATAEQRSEERFVGGGQYMAPECREDGGVVVGAPRGPYAPSACDIWALGIILLNLITGREPWSEPTTGDPAFYLCCTDPARFFGGLPTSYEVDMLLEQTLEVDWTRRSTTAQMRGHLVVTNWFHSPEGALALGVDEDTRATTDAEMPYRLRSRPQLQSMPAQNAWSRETPRHFGTLFAQPVDPVPDLEAICDPLAASYISYGTHTDIVFDFSADTSPGLYTGDTADGGLAPLGKPTEVGVGDGAIELPSEPLVDSETLSPALPEPPQPSPAAEQPVVSASDPDSEVHWRAWDEHALNMSMLSLPRTEQEVLSYDTETARHFGTLFAQRVDPVPDLAAALFLGHLDAICDPLPSSCISYGTHTDIVFGFSADTSPGLCTGDTADGGLAPLGKPTAVDSGNGPIELPSEPAVDSATSPPALPEPPQPSPAAEQPAVSASDPDFEVHWRAWDEHALNMSMLSLPRTEQDVLAYHTNPSTASNIHLLTGAAAGATYPAGHAADAPALSLSLGESRASPHPRPLLDLLAPIRIAFFRRLCARPSLASLETFMTCESRFSAPLVEPDGDSVEWRSDAHSLQRALDSGDAVVECAEGDWGSVNSMSTRGGVVHHAAVF